MEADVVRMEQINKAFPGVQALRDVSISIRPGEIHAIVGENGAGKSTLIKILMGAYRLDSGEIYIDEKSVHIPNPIVAQDLGLAAVYQDIMLAPHLTVAENIFLGRPPKRRGLVDFKTMYSKARKILDGLECFIDPKALVRELTSVQAEMVAIAKALNRAAKVLILDEPTALLAADETEELFKVARRLRNEGVSIIYISHRLEEIFEICDRVTVMRDGEVVKTLEVEETNQDEVIQLMVGRKLDEMFYKELVTPGREVFKVEGLTRKGVINDISFSVREGEIVGIFGLVGSGRSEIVRAIFGADRIDKGQIYLDGKSIAIKSPVDAIRHRVGLLPENRRLQGLALPLSVTININLANYPDISRFGVVNSPKERVTAEKYVGELSIRTPGLYQPVKFLSGGNQQKVVIAKWLCKNSRILLFDEPTAGVDVGAKSEIFKLFGELVKQGKGIVFISSYLPEILGVCDKIVVLSEGTVTGILDREEADQETILRLATTSNNMHVA